MRISQIIQETTTSGSIATVSQPIGNMQKRMGNKKAGSMFAGKTTNKPFYEAEISEQDLILVPGQGRGMKPGFISKAADRTDREVEMALGDLFQAAKNAKMTYDMLKDVGEDEGIEGWVQEKIIKASDYLNTIREYLENKRLQSEGTMGAIAGGVAGAYLGKSPSAAITGAEIGSALQDTFATEGERTMSRAAKGYEKYGKQGMQALAKAGREGKDLDKIRDKYNKYDEGAKVDRMVKHIEKSEEKAGKSKHEAKNIAWATANKRGMLDNKNKK